MSLTDLLRTGPFLLDGGMGTLLQAKGLRPGEAPETWNLTHPEVIRGIHRDYYDAGSNMVCANTFGVHPLRYALSECEEMICAALRCAEEAKRESAAPGSRARIFADRGNRCTVRRGLRVHRNHERQL